MQSQQNCILFVGALLHVHTVVASEITKQKEQLAEWQTDS